VAQRILFVYPWMHANTGSPRMLLNLIGALDRRRFEPVFLALGEGKLVDEMRANDVEIVQGALRNCSLKSPVDLARQARKAAAQLKAWNIALVHINTWCWNLDLCFGAWLRRLPVVIHSHNQTTVSRLNMTRFIADKVLFVSEHQRSETVGLALIQRKSQVVHNFIDFAHYGSGVDIRDQLGLVPGQFVVATLAQISERKGIATVIETARQCLATHPDMRFLIVGADAVNEDNYAARMRADVAAAGLSEFVRFLGPRADVPDILASADVLLHPALREPFGLVIIEAMAAGKPVVASSIGGIPEILNAVGAGGMLLDPSNAKCFADALISLRNMPGRGRAIGEAGRSGARNHFARETAVLRVERIYEQLLAARALPARSTFG
jgi:glycosyltransferase involved in cell wall biosynthesis